MALMNGVQIAQNIAKKSLSPELAQNSERIVSDIFSKKFDSNSHYLDGNHMHQYHKAIHAIIEECTRFEIGPKVTHAWLNVITDRYENALWQDSSSGQKADLFVASNSSEMNINLIFGGGRKVEANVMHGNFGVWMNARKECHINNFNDFVPFSYLLTHDNIPAAIIFISEKNATSKCELSGCQSAPASKSLCLSAEELSISRLNKYVSDVRNSKHYADLQAYHHARVNKETGRAEYVKIPLIAAVYDPDSRVVYKVEQNHGSSLRLHEYLVNSGLVSDYRLAELAENLKLHENDEAYTHINKNNHNIKHIGYVDLRIRNILSIGGLIKEIGSIFRESERSRILKSQVCEYVIDMSHTSCGYLNTLVAVHMAGNEMKTKTGGSRPKLMKILEASLDKISNGHVEVLFGDLELKAALNEFGEDNLSSNTKETLRNLISGSSNDIRKTVRHAVKRDKLKFDGGFPVFPAAQKIEDITKELIPGKMLTKAHFDLLVTEESARENYRAFQLLRVPENSVEVTEAIVDLSTGCKLIPREDLPKDADALLDNKRSLFYDPVRELELRHKSL